LKWTLLKLISIVEGIVIIILFIEMFLLKTRVSLPNIRISEISG